MATGKDRPKFNKKGVWVFKGFQGRHFQLHKKTWESHILRDKNRYYLRNQFDKIADTLKDPDCILQSPQEHYVGIYVKKYNDLFIMNTALARAYLYVLVNLNTNIIRTVYSNPRLKGWKRKWQKS